MQTIKTAVVVVLLMVILYGAFVAMNGQPTELPPDLEDMIAMGPDFAIESPSDGSFSGASASSTAPMSFSSNSTSTASALPTSSPSDSPFAMWPGSTPAASPAPSISPALPSALTSPAASQAADTAMPSLLMPPTEIKDKTASSAPPTMIPVSSSSASNAESGIKSDDPWLTTLQNSVPKAEASIAEPPKSDLEVPEIAATSKPAAKAEFSLTSQSFENAKKQALERTDQGKLKEALQTLSVFYNSPELTKEQRVDLIDMLDALASEVIYSRQHLVALPYVTAPGDKLSDIAAAHEVPVELLANINGITDPKNVLPGTKLKVVKGPFRAEIDVKANEMTLFAGELYAGRFPISMGKDPEPRAGVFQVVDKQLDRNYYGPGGIQIDGKDPRNPYGGVWLDLGQQLSIHGSPTNAAADSSALGCISLAPRDASDIFNMLSRGSQVTIKR